MFHREIMASQTQEWKKLAICQCLKFSPDDQDSFDHNIWEITEEKNGKHTTPTMIINGVRLSLCVCVSNLAFLAKGDTQNTSEWRHNHTWPWVRQVLLKSVPIRMCWQTKWSPAPRSDSECSRCVIQLMTRREIAHIIHLKLNPPRVWLRVHRWVIIGD
jgi:hypothetical protein